MTNTRTRERRMTQRELELLREMDSQITTAKVALTAALVSRDYFVKRIMQREQTRLRPLVYTADGGIKHWTIVPDVKSL